MGHLSLPGVIIRWRTAADRILAGSPERLFFSG
jgi:hypothetical protein